MYPPSKTREFLDRYQALFDSGATADEIADEMDYKLVSLYTRLKHNGVDTTELVRRTVAARPPNKGRPPTRREQWKDLRSLGLSHEDTRERMGYTKSEYLFYLGRAGLRKVGKRGHPIDPEWWDT